MTDFGELSPKRDVFINFIPLMLTNLCRRGVRKTVRARGEGWVKEIASSRHNRPDTHVRSQRLGQHTEAHMSLNQAKPQQREGVWTQRSIPSPEAICNRNLLSEGRSVFSSGESLGLPTTLHSKPTPRSSCPKQRGLHGLPLLFVLWVVVLVFFFVWLVILVLFFLVCFDFHFVVIVVCWLDGWVCLLLFLERKLIWS